MQSENGITVKILPRNYFHVHHINLNNCYSESICAIPPFFFQTGATF